MIPTPEQLEYFSRLEAPPAHFKGTGAMPRRPDARDYPALWHPGYRAVAEAGAAQDTDYSNKVCSLTDQGSTGACVIHSTCLGIQVNEEISQNVCYRFNPQQLYAELGGTGSNGIDSRVALQRCKDVGAPLANSNERIRVGSYFLIDSNPATFVDSVKTALTAGKSVVIALLLPSTFGGKWTPGNPTTGYHQLDICGTKDRLFFGPNSWGSAWGGGGGHPPGFYELSFDYCMQDGFQHGYCYAYFFDAVSVGPPPPPPPPPPPVTTRQLSGTVRGAGVGQLAKGQNLEVKLYNPDMTGTAFVGDLTVTAISDDNPPPPPPPPGPLSVTGYTPNPIKGGASFIIQGQGFQGGNLTALWQGRPLTANRLSDAQIQAVAPSVATTASDAVTVRVEALTATGPLLTVTASDVTPGDLKVTVMARRYSRGLVGIWAYVQAPGSEALDLILPATDDFVIPPTLLNPDAGGYVAANVGGFIGPLVLAARRTTPSGIPCVWQVSGPSEPALITINAVDDQDRRGTASLTI